MLVVLIVLYVGSQLFSTLLMSTTTDRTQRMIFLALPFFFVIFVIHFPAGLLVYWITTNLGRSCSRRSSGSGSGRCDQPATAAKARRIGGAREAAAAAAGRARSRDDKPAGRARGKQRDRRDGDGGGEPKGAARRPAAGAAAQEEEASGRRR